MNYKLHVAFSNREDMLKDAVRSVRDIGNIHIWPNNGANDPGIPDTTVHPLPSLSAVDAINMMIHSSWDDDVMFWMHNDAYAPPGTAAKLLDKVRSMDGKWGVVFTTYDVLCAFNMKCIREIGYWDPMFFQYTADLDFYWRMRAAGWSETYYLKDEIEHRQGSSTIKADPIYNMRVQWRQNSGFDRAYYEQKWGGPPHKERFKIPFNGSRGVVRR